MRQREYLVVTRNGDAVPARMTRRLARKLRDSARVPVATFTPGEGWKK